jgi:ABC-type Zn uptake system ZnuABC Zn-binding protein ZnuA
LQPKSAETFNANLNKFVANLDMKLEEWKTALAPFAGRKLASYHNSWPYFLVRFGFQGGLFLEPRPGIPPSPAHLAEVIDAMRSGMVRIIIVEPYVNHRAAEFVANRTDAAVLDFAPYPGGKNAPGDYIGWMDSLVKALAKALTVKTQ